jgi:cyanate permease
MGWIKDATGSYAGGLLSLAAAGLVAAIIALAIGRDPPVECAADP